MLNSNAVNTMRLNPLKNGSQIRTAPHEFTSLASRVLIPLRTGLRFGPRRFANDTGTASLNPLKNGSQIRTHGYLDGKKVIDWS